MIALDSCVLYNSIDVRYHYYLGKLMFLPCCNKLGLKEAQDYDYFVDEKSIEENKFWEEIEKYYNNKKLIEYKCTESCFKLQQSDFKNNYFCDFNKYPLANIHLNISTSCNLYCDMCRSCIQIDKHKDDLYYKALDQLKGHSLNMLEFTTLGEPFLYKERLFNYLDSLDRNKDFKLLVFVSNLTLLNTEDILHLNRIQTEKGINIHLTASIDAVTAETYKLIRKNDKFEQVVQNAILLNKYNMLEFVNFVVQEKNKHELLQAYEFWKEKNIKFQSILVNWSQFNTALSSKNPEKYEVYRMYQSKEYKEYFLKRSLEEKTNSMFFWS